jgi:hypothetical protein
MTYEEETKQFDLQIEMYVKNIRAIVERIVANNNKKSERRNKRIKLDM